MGFLYPWLHVCNDQIPTPESIKAFGLEVVEALRRDSGVRAASIYGSVARGDHTTRSDIDIAIVSQDKQVRRVRRLVSDMRRAGAQKHIIMCPYVITVSQCLTGDVRYGPSYKQTFQELSGSETSFGDIHKYLFLFNKDVREEMSRKLFRNVRQLVREHQEFTDMLKQEDPDKLDTWLERANLHNCQPLHLYMRFARWMLFWRYGEVKDDSKQGVVQAFVQEPSFTVFQKDFQALRQIDVDYDRLLEATRAGLVPQRIYTEQLIFFVREAFALSTHLLFSAVSVMGLRKPVQLTRLSEQLVA
jgi:hypothetical protein